MLMTRAMYTRIAGIGFTIATLLTGCFTTTTTQTCTFGLCSEPETTTSLSVPSSSPQEDSHTGEIIAVGAAMTALALAVVLVKRGGGSDEAKRSVAPSEPAPVYIVPAATSHTPTPHEARLQRMFVQGHLQARAGRCDAVVAIGKSIATTSPSYHDRYVADPTIARCVF